MDDNFRMLGLTRSASQDDVRRAYKQKALQLHPDRNPNGGELFKRVHAAYELVMKHFRNGRPDSDFINLNSPPRSYGANTRGGPSASYRSTAQAPPKSTPLFTEEELFRNINTDFGDFGTKRAHSFSNGTGGGRSSSSLGGSTSTYAGMGGRPFRQRDHASTGGFDTEEKIARDRAEAGRSKTGHGERVNVSGYTPNEADAHAQWQFEEMERRKRRGSRDNDPPTPPPRRNSNTSSAPASPEKASFSAASTAPQTSSTSPHRSSPGSAASRRAKNLYQGMPTRSQLQQEWEEHRRTQQAEEEIEERRKQMDAAARKQKLDKEVRDEWERMQREMEQTRHDEEVERTMRDTQIKVEEENAADEALRELAAQRRQTKRDMFANQLPGKSAIEKMSEMELYLLDQVLLEARERIKSETAHRRYQPCVVCSASKRMTKSSLNASGAKATSPSKLQTLFMCEHECVCQSCFKTALSGCPICGAPKY